MENSMFSYEMKGELDPITQKQREKKASEKPSSPRSRPSSPLSEVEAFRKMQKGCQENVWDKDPINMKYHDLCKISETEIDIKENRKIKCLIHEIEEKINEKSSCLIYVHGGGGIGFDAKGYSFVCNRIAVDNQTKVFNVDYTCAPEANVSEIAEEIYCVINRIYYNHEKYNIDPERIVLSGDSAGGGLAVSACVKLVQKNCQHFIKLSIPIQPSVGDTVIRKPIDSLSNVFEKEYIGKKKLFVRSLMQISDQDPDYETKMNNLVGNTYIFPMYIKDDVAEKFPKTVLFTSEFDYNKQDTDILANTLQKNSALLEYCCHPQGTHGFQIMMSNPLAEMFWKDFNMVFKKFV